MASEDDIKECFDTFAGKGGKLDISDLGTVIRALGKAPSEKQMIEIEDSFGDKKNLSYNDFKSAYRKKMKRPQDLEDSMKSAFQALDNSGKGYVSEADLRILLGTLGEALEPGEVDSFLSVLEADSDGNVNYYDLVATVVG